MKEFNLTPTQSVSEEKKNADCGWYHICFGRCIDDMV